MGLDDLLKGNLATGLAIGIAGLFLAPTVLPAVGRMAKPLAKAAIKGGLIAYEKGREMMAEAGEVVEDLTAEARAELKQGAETSGQAPAEGGSAPAHQH